MDIRADAALTAPPGEVRKAIDDLGTYPHWLAIVDSATPAGRQAWDVVLVGRLGLLAYRKRVRMVRSAPAHFERRELDPSSQDHEWILDATAAASRPGTKLSVRLRYTGTLPPGIDLLLRREMADAGGRLDAYLAAGPGVRPAR